MLLVWTVRREVLGEELLAGGVEAGCVEAAALAALYDAYHRSFELQWTKLEQKQQAAVSDLVDVLSAAQEPLALSLLQHMGLHDACPLLPGWGVLFYAAEHRVCLVHKSLADWLADPTTDARFRSHAAHGHLRLARHLAAGVLAHASSMHGTYLPYALRYLMSHLAQAIRTQSICSPAGAAGTAEQHKLPLQSAQALLDAVLRQWHFLAALIEQQGVENLLAEMGRLSRSTCSLSVWTADMLRLLRWDQYKLKGHDCDAFEREWATGRRQLSLCLSALAAPARSLVRAHAERVAAVLFGSGGPAGWRCVLTWPAEPATWAETEITLGYSTMAGGYAHCNVAFLPGCKVLVEGSDTPCMKLWDTVTGTYLGTLLGGKGLTMEAPSGVDDGDSDQDSSNDSDDSYDSDLGTDYETPCDAERATCVACSPDGRLVAAGNKGGCIRVWDVMTGGRIAILDGAVKPADTPVCDPTAPGSHKAASTASAASAAAAVAPAAPTSAASAAAAVAPAASGASSSSEVPSALMVSLNGSETGEDLAERWPQRPAVRCVAYSPDSTRLVSGSSDHTLTLWDVAAAECLATFEGHSGSVTCVAYSPCGRQVASGSCDGTVRLWDAATGACSATWAVACEAAGEAAGVSGGAEAVRVLCVAYRPDGTQLACSTSNGCVQLWDPRVGICVAVLRGHTGDVPGVAYRSDGLQLASGGRDKTVRLWDPATHACTRVLQTRASGEGGVAYSSDGQQLVCGNTPIGLWEVGQEGASGGGAPAGQRGPTGPTNATAASMVATPALAAAPTAVSAAVPAALAAPVPAARTMDVGYLEFSPCGTQLVLVDQWKRTVAGVDVQTGAPSTVPVAAFARRAVDAALSPDSTLRACVTNQVLSLMQVHTGTVTLLEKRVRCVAFSTDGKYLACGTWNGDVKLLDVASGSYDCRATLQGANVAAVRCVAFSADGSMLASCTNDGHVRLYCRPQDAWAGE